MVKPCVALLLSLLLTSPAAAEPPPSDQTTINKTLIYHLIDARKRISTLEAEIGKLNSSIKSKSKSAGDDEAVDLSNLQVGSPTQSSADATGLKPTHGAPTGLTPNLKVFFDTLLYNKPGETETTFSSFHNLLLFEILPSPDLQFSFEVRPAPRYFELDYQITPKLQIRVGKIFIPFDDLSPHNVFGGRVNVSTLNPGSNRFLPDLWTDLGVGLKYELVDQPKFSLESQLYLVNGIGSGGVDPTGSSNPYPNFAGTDAGLFATDNNANKAIGGRLRALFWRSLTLGVSYYYDTSWQDQALSPLGMLGVDASLRLSQTEIRAGYAASSVTLPSRPMSRYGYYGEIGRKFGGQDRWKLLLRGGQVQADDGVISSTSDYQIVGAALLYRLGVVELSIEQSRDLDRNPRKRSFVYNALRMVVAL